MSFMDKVTGIFFKEEEEDDYQEEPIAQAAIQTSSRDRVDYQSRESTRDSYDKRDIWGENDTRAKKKGGLMAIPTQPKTTEMILLKASSYDDLQSIARHIKERRVVIVNFEDMPKDVAQRMVDFLSGAVFALDGAPKKVSGGTFLFSSSQVDLSGQIMANDSDFSAASNSAGFDSFNWLEK